MAAAFRPTVFRRALAGVSRTPTTSALPAFRFAGNTSRPSLLLQQRAAFQTTTKRAILPALPQTVEGTVNDAAKVPHAEPSHGSYHWSFERLVSAALVPITVAPFAAGSLSPLIDGTLIGLLIIHTYIGFQSIITDYLPKWRVPFSRKLADWGNVLAVFVVGWGFYEFETNDVGLTQGIKRVWTARRE